MLTTCRGPLPIHKTWKETPAGRNKTSSHLQHAAKASLNVREELQTPDFCCWSGDKTTAKESSATALPMNGIPPWREL